MRRHVVLVALVLGCASQRDVVGAALGVAGPAIVEFHVRERAACIEIAKTREEATACMVLVDDRYVPLEKTRADTLDPVMLYLAPAFANFGKPAIAAINGVAAGAGMSLALLCDVRLASDKSRFAASWINVGLTPDCGATYLLPRTIGVDRALKLFFTGEPIDAREAERIGLVTEVVAHDDLMKNALDLARKIASGPSIAIELTKRAAHWGMVSDLTSQLHFENYAQELCFKSSDFKEGVRAFLEKRRPSFSGK